MAQRRTYIYTDDGDLALIKEAAARLGVPEAEVIRESIHRIALAHRSRAEPFVTDEETFDLGGPVTSADYGRSAAVSSAARSTNVQPCSPMTSCEATTQRISGSP
ncbi:hypothetical protein OIE62_26370 [Streptomyces scopuliridis]|uniref:Uncharacterized protein n=1 Tax=Streptomyces scopuliridis TaxID=452529 RepID=A0ACD4ZIJ9_9ACTN|nr:hypothetical protein [Streptomyces scopuliridis]WSB98125.1 hypothetical protein OG835_14570 [Streptomyces scopuliridis]WSC08173.1 hypothetical protein OIE62_26370 [Streptomyces scopuliridis]